MNRIFLIRVSVILGLAMAVCQVRASNRDDVLGRLKEVASSPNYYWAWTYPWIGNRMPTDDMRHVVERDGRLFPKPTDEVKLESIYQKYADGRRSLINYTDLALTTGTFGPDRSYQINRAAHTATIKRQWKELGAIQVFSWHMDQPYCTNGFEARPYRYKSEGANRNVIRQILDGTGDPCGTDTVLARGARQPFRNPREWFFASLQNVADLFNSLVDDETGQKIPVVLRYPHECDGSWFWWGRIWCTPDELRRFCRMEADYLREKCGKDQIIFAYTPDRTWSEFGHEGDTNNTFLAYYPGDKYVDVIGVDDYSIGNGGDKEVEERLSETVRKLRLMTKFGDERGKVVCISESGGNQKRDDFWQYLHRAAMAEGVKVAFVDTWGLNWGSLPATPASEADEKAFAARPQVLMEGSGNGFRRRQSEVKR